jgi:hypothetical protein
MPDSALIKAVQSGSREDFSNIIESKTAEKKQKDSNGFSCNTVGIVERLFRYRRNFTSKWSQNQR